MRSIATDEGFYLAAKFHITPHPAASSRHLLPQGEKVRRALTFRPSRKSSIASSRPSPENSSPCAAPPSPRPCPAPPPPAGRSAATPRCRLRRAAHHRAYRSDTASIVPAFGHANHLARRQRHKPFADQIEIGDAVDFVVVGDAAVAVAKTDLRPHIDLDVLAAPGGTATKRAARGPAVARKRPRDFAPVRDLRPRVLIGRNARQGADRQSRNHDDRPATHHRPLWQAGDGARRRRSVPEYASRCWRGRRCRYSRARRSRHCWSGSRPCSGPCRRS